MALIPVDGQVRLIVLVLKIKGLEALADGFDRLTLTAGNTLTAFWAKAVVNEAAASADIAPK
jgi:hypothetical protein